MLFYFVSSSSKDLNFTSKNFPFFIPISVILPNVPYREECRLRVFENRIFSKIFGPIKDKNEVWTSFHNEELHSLYHSPNTVRMIKSRN